jgi:hypothetical protein
VSGRHDDSDEAARLVERVLADPEFRQRLRRDPNLQPALETLELRESKSSLAGALAAAERRAEVRLMPLPSAQILRGPSSSARIGRRTDEIDALLMPRPRAHSGPEGGNPRCYLGVSDGT